MTEEKALKKRRSVVWYWIGVALLLLAFFLYWLLYWRFIEYTNDAYVEGNLVVLTPLKKGFVKAIHTDDTFLVKKGELVIELDTTDADIALAHAQANLGNAVRDVAQRVHQTYRWRSAIETQHAELIRTTQDYLHRFSVLDEEAVSLEDFEHSVASLHSTFSNLMSSQALFEQERSTLQGTSIIDHPTVQAHAQTLRNTWVQRYRCNVYAPVEGLVAQRNVQVGMWLDEGSAMMAIIPLDQIWVNANYKETQMSNIRLGQSVEVTSDYWGSDVHYRGTVVGLPGGAGNAFTLLPPSNLSGNWIKIVQRLPVRVALHPDDLLKYPLRVGLSMEARVDIRTTDGLIVPHDNQNAPYYHTPIFAKEEEGVDELFREIFFQNLDPSLMHFAENPIVIEMPAINADLVNLAKDLLEKSRHWTPTTYGN